ncbi:uncharacterized protein LOC126809797 isoform X5 [Patella vulgata]|uniref:uncharacterized protein LOC126809797 isoform X5 n=1 Tax=Patella vulgata TaxID=6465 RepID=UPI00218090A3|nr:uncharacterized protein LOC126809797 isoform X5 [Patella vulgata]
MEKIRYTKRTTNKRSYNFAEEPVQSKRIELDDNLPVSLTIIDKNSDLSKEQNVIQPVTDENDLTKVDKDTGKPLLSEEDLPLLQQDLEEADENEGETSSDINKAVDEVDFTMQASDVKLTDVKLSKKKLTHSVSPFKNDKTGIQQAQKRFKNKSMKPQSSGSSEEEISPWAHIQKSSLSKCTKASSSSTKSQSVLPGLCIICKKKDIFRTVAYKRQKDKLVQAETEDAGQLRTAAEMKADENILLHIRGKNCVAIEVRYHAYCYRKYTNFLRNIKVQSSKVDKTLGVAYDAFRRQIVDDKIIQAQEIMRMTRLTSIFHQMIAQLEGPDTGLPKADSLKQQLRRDYPQLSFHSPLHTVKSEMVFVDALPDENLLDQLPTPSSDTVVTNVQSILSQQCQIPFEELNLTQTLYDASLLIRNSLHYHSNLASPRPPTAEHFTLEACAAVVPVELYNFLVWCTGYSEDRTISETLELQRNIERRIVSLCQDIVYLASRG